MFSVISNTDAGEIWMLSKSPKSWIDKLLSTPNINDTISFDPEVIETRTEKQIDECLVLNASLHLKYANCEIKKSFLCQIASPEDTRTFQPLPRFPCLSGNGNQRKKRSNHAIDNESNEGKYNRFIRKVELANNAL